MYSNNKRFLFMYRRALRMIRSKKLQPSVSMIHRNFRCGYRQSSRILSKLENQGIVSKPNVWGVREVLR